MRISIRFLFVFGMAGVPLRTQAQAQLFAPPAEDLPRWEARISAWPMVQNAINLFDGKDTVQLHHLFSALGHPSRIMEMIEIPPRIASQLPGPSGPGYGDSEG